MTPGIELLPSGFRTGAVAAQTMLGLTEVRAAAFRGKSAQMMKPGQGRAAFPL
jgi:hypothetical protein